MAENGEKRDPSSHRTPGQIKWKNRGYDAKPENRKKRSLNNKARRHLKLPVGDPRDAHHVKPLREGGGNTKGNLRAVDRSKNRAWAKKSRSKASPSERASDRKKRR